MVLTNKQVTDLVTTRPVGQSGWELGHETSCPPLASSRTGGIGAARFGGQFAPHPIFADVKDQQNMSLLITFRFQ